MDPIHAYELVEKEQEKLFVIVEKGVYGFQPCYSKYKLQHVGCSQVNLIVLVQQKTKVNWGGLLYYATTQQKEK